MDTPEQKRRSPPGPEPETVRIDLTFEEAVRKALQKPIPPGGIPERPTRPRRATKARER